MTWIRQQRGVYRLLDTEYRVMKNVAVGGWNVFSNSGNQGNFGTLTLAKIEAERMSRHGTDNN